MCARRRPGRRWKTSQTGHGARNVRQLTRGFADIDMVVSLDDELASVCVRRFHEDKSQVCKTHMTVSPKTIITELKILSSPMQQNSYFLHRLEKNQFAVLVIHTDGAHTP